MINSINTLIRHNPYFIVFLLICFNFTEVEGQIDSIKLHGLIQEINENFLLVYAQGVILSPYEILQHNRDRTIKNVEMVDAFDLFRFFSSKQDTIPYIVENNQTIIQKPTERFNSRTYLYHKDGRIDKILRGRHLDDLFLPDEDGFLIQHGYGGELKRAKRQGKTFEWYNAKRNRLEYITAYNEQDRLSSIKTMGHHFGPAVDYEIEDYSWSEGQLVAKSTIEKYKEGRADSTFTRFEYDSLGLIQTLRHRNSETTNWSSVTYSTKIEQLDTNLIKITISHENNQFLSMTFDQYDNWVEMMKYANTYKRIIKYRKTKRRK